MWNIGIKAYTRKTIMSWHAFFQHIVSNPMHYFLRRWLWFLCATIFCIVVVIVRRRYTVEPAIETKIADVVSELDMKPIQDSPFFAYLGHNAVTEATAPNPNNTSTHAVDRVSEHVKHRSLGVAMPEPQGHEASNFRGTSASGQWRNHTYPDSPNRQVSYDSSQIMLDEESRRQWQRRTVHFCGV